ncbi:PEP-CTERM sorting domain-containing protein [Roseiconus nitratireducens]|uniref:PEP-CTERM sorting domain-containing protein n=1 Tax=Roseiconus nitratireducens TaxID=2605748 RepID=A0A5M6D1S0_9BACT|nr:PEP-CTERM sorting domain-containing protein [Roseiconus nitratireducens]KAA5541434.1 PEP-CTERM sorting domain-containing protein [Roseiconus nitratireducens]
MCHPSSRPFFGTHCLYLFFGVALLVDVVPARGELLVTIEDGMIAPNGNLSLDIGIESDTPPELLSEFEFSVRLNPMPAAPGSSLQFVDSQSESFLSDPEYVFFGNSDSLTFGAVTYDSTTQITVFDLTADFTDVPVSSRRLLTTIELRHQTGSASVGQVAGNQFEVTLGPDPLFFNADGFEVPFSLTSGIVTVAATAVPEPGTTAFLALTLTGAAMRRRRRPRGHRT